MTNVRDVGIVWLSVGALALLAIGVCIDKPASLSLLPPCPFHQLTGLLCPGCGSTRMIYYLLHGRPMMAFRQNPLAMIALPGVVWGLSRQLIFHEHRLMQARTASLSNLGIFMVVILFTILRNIPGELFSWLRPTTFPG